LTSPALQPDSTSASASSRVTLGKPLPSPTGRLPPWARWAIGLAIGVLFTWWSSRSWPIDALFGGVLSVGRDATGELAIQHRRSETGSVLWSVDLWAIGAYSLILFVIHWLRVLRWKPLLLPYADVPVRVLNRVGAVGFMAVFLLPLRLGELARPLMLVQPRPLEGQASVPFGAGLGSIAVERVLDGLVVTLMLFSVLIQVPAATLARHPEVELGAWIAFAVFGGALVALGLTMVARDWTLRTTRAVVGVVSKGLAEKLIGLVTSFVDGLAILKSPWLILEFVGMTITYWGLAGFGIYVLARGFGLDIPVVAAYAMMSCVVVGMMIPNSPGNVGSFWYFLLMPVGLYGLQGDSPRTIAFALGLWFAQTAQQTAFGVWGWWSEGRASARERRQDRLASGIASPDLRG
jgi:uncharacterized protein (TIRG00374 family)